MKTKSILVRKKCSFHITKNVWLDIREASDSTFKTGKKRYSGSKRKKGEYRVAELVHHDRYSLFLYYP